MTTLTLWTGDFARPMRSTAETLSRWEHGRASVGAADDGPGNSRRRRVVFPALRGPVTISAGKWRAARRISSPSRRGMNRM